MSIRKQSSQKKIFVEGSIVDDTDSGVTTQQPGDRYFLAQQLVKISAQVFRRVPFQQVLLSFHGHALHYLLGCHRGQGSH